MTANCNCASTTRVHNGDCPANEATRTLVACDCRPGDIIVIPNYLGQNLDHALMVCDTFPGKVNLITPAGNKAAFEYVDLLVLGAYYIWNRPVQGPPTGFLGGLL